MAVEAHQRFTKSRPCPICGGYEQAPRGQGIRCTGYLSDDGEWALCSREEHGGTLSMNNNSQTYAHLLSGDCRCGKEHSQGSSTTAASKPTNSRQVATFDYWDQDDKQFQVVKLEPKGFFQRRLDENGNWVNDMEGISKPLPLYRLKELLASDEGETVYISEGEKDCDRVRSLGLVSVTTIMGAGKARHSDLTSLKDRNIVLLPHHDEPGRDHMNDIGEGLQGIAASVRTLTLTGLPERGDVSDWLDHGHTVDELVDLALQSFFYSPKNQNTAPATNGHQDPSDIGDPDEFYSGAANRTLSQKIIHRGLLSNGFLIRTPDNREHFYFDASTKRVLAIEEFDMAVLLSKRYRINASERLYNFLIGDLKVEAATDGTEATVRSFFHYDGKANLLHMDMGKGRVLRLDGQEISIVDNGTNGVLFRSTDQDPWDYDSGVSPMLFPKLLIEPINFSEMGDQVAHTPDEQRLLLLIWYITIAFGSDMPTKPAVLAKGQPGSGKSYMFRIIGKVLYGPEFNVDSVSDDSEKDFWVAVTNNPFVVIDNADGRVRWLEQALLKVATGARMTKKVLYTTNESASYVANAFVALTAKDPRFRAVDLSQRLIIFHLDKITEYKDEQTLTAEIMSQRNQLLSAYAKLLNKVIAVTDAPSLDTGVRMADFAGMASRVAVALDRQDATRAALGKMKHSQHEYSVEESPIMMLIDEWIDREPPDEARLFAEETNQGRPLNTKVLLAEFRAIAKELQIDFYVSNPKSLGRQLQEMKEPLELYFKLEHKRNRRGGVWTIRRKEEYYPDDSDETPETA